MNISEIIESVEPFISSLFSLWFPLLFISGMVEAVFFIRLKGSLKRGFKVWSKPLPERFHKYLLSLDTDVIESKRFFFAPGNEGFIRVQGPEVLIRYNRPFWGTSWPCVGFVNLSSPEPVLEFRSVYIMHLFLLPFILSIVLIPFVAGMMLFNYYLEITGIENFLKRKVEDK